MVVDDLSQRDAIEPRSDLILGFWTVRLADSRQSDLLKHVGCGMWIGQSSANDGQKPALVLIEQRTPVPNFGRVARCHVWVKEDRIIGAIATAEDSRLKGVDPLKDPTENQLDFTTKPAPRSDPSDPSDPSAPRNRCQASMARRP